MNGLEETLSIGFTKITEPFPVVVEAVDIQYLAMYYLLAPAEETSVRIGFFMATNSGSIINSFLNVPLRRNYRTNIYGALFSNVPFLDSSDVITNRDITFSLKSEENNNSEL
ncbi:MAG: hypothetical protein LUJ25_00540 [Firmicutes bacterium]|nr:hypothetical protein [Bacillota bacterium]